MRNIRLPEFDKNRRISQHNALVYDNNSCKYDIILGTDFLSKIRIKLDDENGNVSWFDASLPMRPPHGLISSNFDTMEDQYFVQMKDKLFGKDWFNTFATEILDAKYEFADVKDVVEKQNHLDAS